MWRNYLAAALRNLARNKLYASINIVGLAIAFAAAIFIGLFIRNEFSYERWIPGHERTYLVSEIVDMGGATPMTMMSSPAEIAAWLRRDFPQIQSIARLYPTRASVGHGDIEGSDQIWWADADLFNVLPLPVIAGDIDSALHRPDAIVLTRKMARKYFGQDAPIGKALELDRTHSMVVTAVIDDLPSNTQFSFGILVSGSASFSPLTDSDSKPPPLASGNNASPVFTLLRLKPGASILALRNAIPAFVKRHVPASTTLKVDFPVTAIADLHLKPPISAAAREGILTTLDAVMAIGVLIVLIAGVNFVNLMTAHASQRATEVGVRKATGAGKRDLVAQFIGECLFHAALAAAIATACVETLLPVFNGFLDRTIAFNYWRDPGLMAGILSLIVLVGILGGVYPGFVLARMHPASILGGNDLRSGGSRAVRHFLVVMQFAVLIGLILAAATVHRQNRHALETSLGAAKDQFHIIVTSCQGAFKQAVKALPGVSDAACSWSLPSEPTGIQSRATSAGRPSIPIWNSSVDIGFFELYGLHPIAGRFFSSDHSGDVVASRPGLIERESVVINATAARKLGFPSPQAAVNQTISCTHPLRLKYDEYTGWHSCEIIGVVPDYAEGSIREPIPPSLYYVFPGAFNYLSVKLQGREVPETLAEIERLWKRLGERRAMRHYFLDEGMEALYRDLARQAQTFAAFSGIAVFIAGLGLLGLSAFMAKRRTREIGVRKALGADRFPIINMLLWGFTKPVLWANVVAWPVSYYLMNCWLEGFAYRVDLELWMFIAAGAVALFIALLTVSGQALLVARARPVDALRYE